MPSTVKGTLQFMAPELIFTTTSNEPASINGYAADMWSLGEVAYQMLTKRPAFPLLDLLQYVQGSRPFPSSILVQFNVSNHGQHFMSSTMLPAPDNRLNTEQAWNHDWIRQFSSSISSPPVTEPARYCTLSAISNHMYA
jgi:serine/threonine protein kinase